MRKSILDDRIATAKIDRENMLQILEESPTAYEEAYDSALRSKNLPQMLSSPPTYLAFMGMGGSAIVADILKEWFYDGKTSIEVIRAPRLPGSIGAGTCVIVSSYSGQTGEALEALGEARKRGAQIACIGSGGRLLELCRENGIPHVDVRAGLQPREALPHLLCASLVILERWAVCDHEAIGAELRILKEQLEDTMKSVGFEKPRAKNPAKRLAIALNGTVPFIYSSQRLAPAGRRFKNQLNENSKVLSKFEVLPEILHNEIEGLHMKGRFADSISFVLLRDQENEDDAEQFKLLKRVIKRGGKKIYEIHLKAPTVPAAILTTIYFCDFVAFYLAITRGMDPTPVRTIQSLKHLRHF